MTQPQAKPKKSPKPTPPYDKKDVAMLKFRNEVKRIK